MDKITTKMRMNRGPKTKIIFSKNFISITNKTRKSNPFNVKLHKQKHLQNEKKHLRTFTHLLCLCGASAPVDDLEIPPAGSESGFSPFNGVLCTESNAVLRDLRIPVK